MISPYELLTLITRPNPVIFDIGCHDGRDTQMFLDLFHTARVSCFEPDPRGQVHFCGRIKDPRARLFSVAVGSYDGPARFYPSRGTWDQSGSLHKPTGHLLAHPSIAFDDPIEVMEVRLDTWAAMHSIDHVDFIWCDVQGAERDVIEGGCKTLERTAFFYTEYSNVEMYEGQATLDELRAMLPDFDAVRVYQHDVLFRNKSV